MKIEFQKIGSTPIPIQFKKNSVSISGILRKINTNLAKLECQIFGEIPNYICNRCGIEFNLEIKQNLTLLLSNGIFQEEENQLSDVMEFFDGFIDIEEILTSEIEAYKSDYFYCLDCKIKNEGE